MLQDVEEHIDGGLDPSSDKLLTDCSSFVTSFVFVWIVCCIVDHFIFMIVDGGITFFIFDQLVIEILQILKVSNCVLLVILTVLLRLFEFVALDLEYFEVVFQTVQVLNIVFKAIKLIVTN